MTEAEWNECADPQKMLEFLRGKVSDRKLRLFAVGCCRRIWHRLNDERSRRGVDVAERYADGMADDAELDGASTAAWAVGDRDILGGPLAAAEAVGEALWSEDDYGGEYHASLASYNAWFAAGETRREREAQCGMLRDVIGNPFSHTRPNPQCLTTNVKQLTESIYQDRAFDRLPILADALEDAGCNQPDILQHCRQPGEHVRGCWVVDLLTGRK